jgi:hypothetical protein
MTAWGLEAGHVGEFVEARTNEVAEAQTKASKASVAAKSEVGDKVLAVKVQLDAILDELGKIDHPKTVAEADYSELTIFYNGDLTNSQLYTRYPRIVGSKIMRDGLANEIRQTLAPRWDTYKRSILSSLAVADDLRGEDVKVLRAFIARLDEIVTKA